MPCRIAAPTMRAMKTTSKTLALACALMFVAPVSMARQDDANLDALVGDGPAVVHDVPRIDAEMTVDGRLDEPFWADAVQIAIDVETRPGDNIRASVAAVAYLVDNGHELLVGFRAEDPDPSQIRAFLRDRDSLWNDDFIGITIDTFDDQRRGYEFYINPLGAQGDLIIEEASGNEDSSWDGLWDSAGQITDFGYTGEMRIPYSTLRFQKSGAPQQWSIDVLRFRPRDYRYRLSNNRLPRGANCYLCELSKLRGFADANPGRDLEVTPTLTVRSSRHRMRPDQDWHNDGTDIEPQLLTIYRADDTTGAPTNGTYTSCSNCWRFEWDDVNEEWDSLGSATWDAADMEACGDEVHTDYVGVWVQGRHEFVTTIVTFDMDIDARVTMRLEPLIGSSSCR